MLPVRSVPLLASEMKRDFAEDLAKCKMSIHPVGKRYGLVPEGSTLSMLEIENELAIERGRAESFVRLLWIPKGLIQRWKPKNVKGFVWIIQEDNRGSLAKIEPSA